MGRRSRSAPARATVCHADLRAPQALRASGKRPADLDCGELILTVADIETPEARVPMNALARSEAGETAPSVAEGREPGPWLRRREPDRHVRSHPSPQASADAVAALPVGRAAVRGPRQHLDALAPAGTLEKGESTTELFAFVTTAPNAEVAHANPTAMPLLVPERIETCHEAETAGAMELLGPLPDGARRDARRRDPVPSLSAGHRACRTRTGRT